MVIKLLVTRRAQPSLNLFCCTRALLLNLFARVLLSFLLFTMMTTNKTETSYNPAPREHLREVDTPSLSPPMSLLGLQERALHYTDLSQVLRQPTQVKAKAEAATKLRIAPLPVQPGQDTRDAFHRHLLSVLSAAVAILDEAPSPSGQ